ncbi:MAG: FG-GAP repeat domain-containing protein [Saprospiraceae bacterium]
MTCLTGMSYAGPTEISETPVASSIDDPKDEKPCGAFDNGGFEDNKDGFWGEGSMSMSNDAYAGSKAGRVNSDAAIGFNVKAKKEETFSLSFYAKVESSGVGSVGIDFKDKDGNEISEIQSPQVVGTTYKQYTIPIFECPYGTDEIAVWFYSPSGTNLIVDEICLTKNPEVVPATTWEDKSKEWNLDVKGTKAGGMSFYDFDKDGDLDILVNTSEGKYGSKLLRNEGNEEFKDVTKEFAPDLSKSVLERSAVWGDLNNDGYADFVRNKSFTTSSVSSIEIYMQDPSTGKFGDGKGGSKPIYVGDNAALVDIFVHDGCNTEGLGFMDFDGDGDLDIIFDNHNYGVDILRNTTIDHKTMRHTGSSGGDLFEHATKRNGASTVLGLNQTATDGDYGAFVDINDDGWVDIFMRKSNENDFFLNVGGTFTNGQDLAEATNNNKGSNAIYDFDNDGDFDVFWTENDINQIFRNDFGNWTPLGLAGSTGIPTDFSTEINEAAGGDIDNDGDIDLFLVGNDRTFLYINQLNDPVLGVDVGQPMTFVLDDSEDFTKGEKAYGTLLVDIDNDGDLDVYFNRSKGNRLYINELYTPSDPNDMKDLLYVEVIDDRNIYMDPSAQRPAIGATVVLTDCNGRVLSGMRELSGGNSRGVQNPTKIHFGLPYGRNYNYNVVVKYPNYKDINGNVTRTIISKTFNPSLNGNTIPVISFLSGDADDSCPTILEICDNGIDDDGDGLIDCDDPECGGITMQHQIGQ